MIEILAKNIERLFSDTTNRKYCSDRFDVWEISDEVFSALCGMSDEEFEQKCPYGWWRSAAGSCLGSPDDTFTVNGQTIRAWDGKLRLNYYHDNCKDCEEFENTCQGNDEDLKICLGERKYDNLLTYLCEELGASSEKNVCALCVDLAKYNNMTMTELFQKYQG